MIDTQTEPKHGWGVFESTLDHPFREVVPITADERVADGHIRGLGCECQPSFEAGESRWTEGEIIVVHRMLMSDFE
jgi:hypothetical protein